MSEDNPNEKYAALYKKKVRFTPMLGLTLIVSDRAISLDELKGTVLGYTKFESSLDSREIIDDFSKTYPRQLSSGFASMADAKYPISCEPTIAPAFVNYFSNLKS